MNSAVEKFNAAVPWPLRLLMVFGVAAIIYYSGLVAFIAYTVGAVSLKVSGNAPDCPWSKIVTYYPNLRQLELLVRDERDRLEVRSYDESFGIELISDSERQYWIRRQGADWGGKALLAYLLGEHEWMASQNPDNVVREGDIVLDCGAHVGVFTQKALDLGAAKVVAIDPDPIQVECLQRNFSAEIASGRVLLVPKGVWSSEGSLTFHVGFINSGSSSVVLEREPGTRQVEVPVTTIDKLVAELNLPRVDYIKLDIEGAEGDALQGAMETLRKYRPRLMIDSNHRPDDLTRLPAIIAQAHSDYQMICGSCEPRDGILAPHYAFYQ